MSDIIKCPNCLKEHFTNLDIKPGDKRIFKGNCKSCKLPLKFKLNRTDHLGLIEQDYIKFSINGIDYNVSNTYPPNTTLASYLRDTLNMKGTKIMCQEGGCGSCLVNAEVFDYSTKKIKNISINSCLFPLYSCDGIKFTTIEGVGSKKTGFNEIQKRIADNNGTQCGWCTPGMVMNMYNLLIENPKPQKQEIENSMDGNLCRCTGYRSILTAMKSFATDEVPIEIEELNKLKCLNKSNMCSKSTKNIHLIKENEQWFTPKDMDSLNVLLSQYGSMAYRLVSGNTGIGVYKNDGPYQIYIDLKSIEELYEIKIYPELIEIGSQVTLSNLINTFKECSSSPGYGYLKVLAHHLSKIANRGVRNTATWGGNLCMKNNHKDFASDIFVCFETVGAILTLTTLSGISVVSTPLDFLSLDLKSKLLYSMKLKPMSNETIIRTFKIMPRSQNAHAYVNAGFRFEIDQNTKKVLSVPSIVYGGISPSFTHAFNTEKYLVGKSLMDESVLIGAFEILNSEIKPNDDPVLASPQYRVSLALSLFYKFVLEVCQNQINPKFLSAIPSLIDNRPLSQGSHTFPDEDPNLYPVTKPMPKLNAYLQASGEAQYTYDKIALHNQLDGAFILSEKSNCKIDSIDDNLARSLPGVVKIIYAKDIPGRNSFMPSSFPTELLFAEEQIDYAGQAVGLVLAENYQIASNAARLVKLKYKDEKPPILNVFDGIRSGSFFPKPTGDFTYGDPDAALKNSPCVIDGDIFLDSQAHFYMENQNALCEETEDGYDVYCATQWIDLVQTGVQELLGLPTCNRVNVRIKQLGGGYGGKITRANITATAAAVGCYHTNRPVRVALDLNTDLNLIGKRFPWYAKYKIGFNNDGKLLAIKIDFYCDSGNAPTDHSMMATPAFADNVYNCPNWFISSNLVKTNLPANTNVRSPGTFPSIAIIESIIEHVAKYLDKEPLEIRQLNLYKKSDVTPIGQPLDYFNAEELINSIRETSEYDKRIVEIKKFNQENRWKKRGISLTPIKWGLGWNGGFFNCSISIYLNDGSISICHGGVEMGQGIHTKVAQVCAYELGVPIEMISIKPADSFNNLNAQCTGGSFTSELVSQACIECCKIILKNFEPARKLLPSGYTWLNLVQKAFRMGIDLGARYWLFPRTEHPFQYLICGTCVTEAEVDVLTGETQIVRSDILYDGGKCTNPEIDLGQAEGAFVMGMGFWLTEKIKHDPKTGILLTNGTWEYKPPTTKDIPIDFRINFLKNNPNPVGILGSKAIGEPPLCLTPCVAFAVKRAIEAARKEINKDEFFSLNSPATVDSIQQLCLVDYRQFKLF
ncbi:unnamed protein product [Brachionus calyciflorus]|uniref:FAD-binding PCMH-type domain-containing protein n=1 Tax=Brachionus calyciflorus TaxID=104777 RepID=A0A813PQG4_9BILA|nr:unnamed protein product [Brachionus calyciflorus]